MAKILKKEEKTSIVIKKLPSEFSSEEFSLKFKELYPNDWIKILNCFEKHEAATKSGKTHPMPHPNQYFKNTQCVA